MVDGRIVIVGMLASLILSCTRPRPSPEPGALPKPLGATPCPTPYERLAVLTATRTQAPAAKPGGASGYSPDDVAAEIVTAELVRRSCQVVDRQEFWATLRGQGLQQNALDQASAVQVGKLAGAGAVVIASVYSSSSEYVLAEMTVKMIDTQTAALRYLETKSTQSAPGEQTAPLQLLKNLVATFSFTPSSVAVSDEGAGSGLQRRTIRKAQRFLRALNYHPGASDGVWGNKTREALRLFQLDHNLAPTGEPDLLTMRELRSLAGKIPIQ